MQNNWYDKKTFVEILIFTADGSDILSFLLYHHVYSKNKIANTVE
jgi:hypothetical protein